jgi:molybdate transport system regulatory protein
MLTRYAHAAAACALAVSLGEFSRVMARYPGLTLRILGDGEPAMGPGKAALIERIAAAGSISAAARAMGMSYRRAWQLVDALNTSFTEPVVTTATGGRHGGGAVVTEFGRRLVDDFRAMEARASAAIASDIERFSKQLRRVSVRRRSR